MIVKDELEYIRKQITNWLKLKYPDATFVDQALHELLSTNDIFEAGACICWLGHTGIDNIDQAIGCLKGYIRNHNNDWPKTHEGRISRVNIFDDPKYMENHPDSKAIYLWVDFEIQQGALKG